MLMPARKCLPATDAGNGNDPATDAPRGRMVGGGVAFERIRRITGYLTGTLRRFNDAKRAEVRDRVRHGLGTGRGDAPDAENAAATDP